MLVVAIDPGITTGLCLKGEALDRVTCVIENCGKAPIEVWKFLERGNFSHIILEQFSASGRIDENCERTLELCGIVKIYAATHSIELTLQAPQKRRAFLKDAKLILQKRGALYMEHELDALAHLLRWDFERAFSQQVRPGRP